MALNWWLLASGLLVLGLAVFHSVLGERYLVRRLLRRTDLPHLFGEDSFTRLTIRYAWHLLTILCVAAAAILFFAAGQPDGDNAAIVWILCVTFAAGGVWGLVSTKARHLSWIVLVVAAVLAGLGAT